MRRGENQIEQGWESMSDGLRFPTRKTVGAQCFDTMNKAGIIMQKD